MRNPCTLTEVLSEKVVDTPIASIPETAMCAARRMVLDTLGVSIAGLHGPGISALIDATCSWQASDESTLWGSGRRAATQDVAMVNAAMAHALDFDDVYVPGSMHPMCILVPVALAVGEHQRRSGREVLAAIVLGMQLAGRLAKACLPRASAERGRWLLPTSIVGVFGAAATASRLCRLDRKATTDALGLAYTQACGNRQALLDAALAKRLQPAFAARAGVTATRLAAAGITGPAHALEGRAGLFALYYPEGDPPDHHALTGTTDKWEIERTSIKRFPSCGAAHAMTQAAIELAREHDLQPDWIEHIQIELLEGGRQLVGRPFELGDNPQVNAQFSAAYGVALGLLYRRAEIDQFTNERILADGDARRLAERISVCTAQETSPVRREDDMPAYFDQREILRIHTTDRRKMTRTMTYRDVLAPERMDEEAVVEKFQACLRFAGDPLVGLSARILDRVNRLSSDETGEELHALLRLATGRTPVT